MCLKITLHGRSRPASLLPSGLLKIKHYCIIANNVVRVPRALAVFVVQRSSYIL
jgi:adenylosuccinate synthase